MRSKGVAEVRMLALDIILIRIHDIPTECKPTEEMRRCLHVSMRQYSISQFPCFLIICNKCDICLLCECDRCKLAFAKVLALLEYFNLLKILDIYSDFGKLPSFLCIF